MRLWIALHLPRLPLEVFSPNWSADNGSVVLEQERVLACSPVARAAGVLPGMRRGGVLMLHPEARLHERTPEREAQALHDVAMALLQYTPLVTQAEEATLLMDVGASLSLFGGVGALCRRIRANLRARRAEPRTEYGNDQDRRIPGTAADQRRDSPVGDGEIHVVQDRDVAIAGAQIANGEKRAHAFLVPR